MLNIYSPNDPTCNATLWEMIHDSIANLPQPNVILGNFNFVEDPLDRLPAHFNNPTMIQNWQSLKSHLSLTDSVLKSGLVRFFCLFWHELDQDRSFRFKKIVGPQLQLLTTSCRRLRGQS